MSGFKPFLAGILAGGCLASAALQYHVVRSHEGIYVVPRSPQHSLTTAYADTRHWSQADWNRHSQVVAALQANGAADLIAPSRDHDEFDLRESLDADPGLDPFHDESPAVRDAIDRLRSHAPIADHDHTQHGSGFLDDVRSELDDSFGNWDQTEPADAGRMTDFQDTRTETLSDPFEDSLSDDPFADSLGEADAFDTGETTRGYVPTPVFDEDDDILNRFDNRSGAIDSYDTETTQYGSDWSDDPWADPNVNRALEEHSLTNRSSPGWRNTPDAQRNAAGTIADTLDGFNSAAGEIASRARDQAAGAALDPLSESSGRPWRDVDQLANSVRDAASAADHWIDEVPDDDPLFSPFREVQ